MKERADARPATFFRPKLAKMIDWQFNGHGSGLTQHRNSCEAD
jgi:hypothetical protein